MLRMALHSQLKYRQSDDHHYTFDIDQSILTLATCYAFNSVLLDPIHRYVVRAIAV